MEVRVKTGESLKCEYTGKEVPALIKIYSHDEKIESAWMGSEALTDALRILHTISVVKVPVAGVAAVQVPANVVPTVFNSVPIPVPEMVAYDSPPQSFREPQINIPGRNPKDPIEMVQQFESAVIELVENPPKTRDNETDGLAETAIRDLIKRFKTSFRNPNAMFNPLRKHIGMSRERFDTLMEGAR